MTDDWQLERDEWLDALDAVIDVHGRAATRELLEALHARAELQGVPFPEAALVTPYRNTIPVDEQPAYPGDLDLEERLENLVRWNALAMVLQANDSGSGVGGHIATYASAATLFEVGFNHVFRPRSESHGGDLVFFQAHASPGVYSRAFLEGRLSEARLRNFRRELQPEGGLPSYPHPRRMPELWQLPTASMGLSTVSAVAQARFARYLENRGLKPRNGGKVWCFIGDGEADEPEVLGTAGLAAREQLDNLVLVVNCNLQRLDGPVRGNGKIIQELERSFRGLGWDVIKVIWSGEWDGLLERDREGVLQARMDEALDGDYQMYSQLPGREVRAHWVRDDARLAEIMKTLSDETVRTIRRGGHDRQKIWAAFERAARRQDGKPTVILAKTIKGYGLGLGAEGSNRAHQKKAMSDEERLDCARRCGVPLSREQVLAAELYRPPEESAELRYLRDRRDALGGAFPVRGEEAPRIEVPGRALWEDLLRGSGGRPVSTTMVFVRLLAKLMRDDAFGRFLVPIVADEARTFGMDGILAQAGIYSPHGQLYRPVDADTITPYREEVAGQVLQEGICEAGALASFIAAGSAWSNHGVPTIPLYVFYSIFGFQRVGDLIWAAADQLCRGFLIGGTSGRTTLNGEGVQHQDGHSQLVAATIPSLVSYDPAFGYEVVLLLIDGLRRMAEERENVLYYLTVANENLPMPAIPAGLEGDVEKDVVRGLYRFVDGPEVTGAGGGESAPRVDLLGSGSILHRVLAARELLAEEGISAAVWSVTSWNELHRAAIEVERWNRLHPAEPARTPWWAEKLAGAASAAGGAAGRGSFVAASDWMRMGGDALARWVPGGFTVLGTDGFGLSEARPELRDRFEVDERHVAHAAAARLVADGRLDPTRARELGETWGIDPEREPSWR